MLDKPPLAEVSTAAIATAAIVALAMLDRRDTRDLLALWAGVISLALVGLDAAPSGLLIGVAAALAAQFIADRRVGQALLAVGLVSVVLVLTKDIDAGLMLGSLLTSAGAGPLLWYSYRGSGQAVTVILIAGTAIGIYANVPDTEQIAVLGAGLAVLAMAMIVFPPIRRTAVSFESLALVGALVVCAGAVGARGRPAAFIGVVGALGVLLAEPVAGLIRRGTRAHPAVLVVIHAGAVIVASRIAGVRESGSAIPIVIGVIAGAAVLLVILPRRRISAS